MMRKVYYLLTILAVALAAASCAKQDTVYKEWVKEGGYIYPAKPLNVQAQQGYKRIVVQWTRPMDPSIRTAKLFWDNYTFEKEFNYNDYPGGVIQTVIEGLEDRSYTFDIVNYDAEGNRSLQAEITTSPFAESWLVSHAERSVLFAEMEGSAARIQMGKATGERGADGDSMFSEVRQDEHFVYLVLADGEEIQLTKGGLYWVYV